MGMEVSDTFTSMLEEDAGTWNSLVNLHGGVKEDR